MKNSFWFGVVLTASILVVVWSFRCADILRGYDAIGGEVFTIALPVFIVWNKLSEQERERQRLKLLNESLKKQVWDGLK